MYDFGQPVPLAVTWRDPAGNLADAGTLKLTIFNLTTGTDTGPLDPVHAGLGSYYFDYAAPNVGHYDVYWVGTGTNAGAIADSFDVQPAPGRYLISLAEARAALNVPAGQTVDDDELRSYIAAATPVVELKCGGAVGLRTITNETYDGFRYGSDINLRVLPVSSVVSVVESGVTLTQGTDYALDTQSSILRRTIGTYFPAYWMNGIRNIVVTYKAGSGTIPPNVTLYVKTLVEYWWQTGQQAQSFDFAAGGATGPAGSGPMDVPDRFDKILGRSADTNGFA